MTKTKFTKDNILRPTEKSGFELGKKRTILGWLQELYLFEEDKDGYIDIKQGWRTRYDKAEKVLRKVAGLSNAQSILFWEETVTETRAATILNKVVKEMDK